MTNSLRQPTLETLGLGKVLDIFKRGALPVSTSDLVDRVFGPPADRGALVISGANGIVGAGKTMQLGSRLEPYGIPIVAMDFVGAPDGIGRQAKGLIRAFGRDKAARIMDNVVQLTYDGVHLPAQLAAYKPRFLLEAIPEILEIKRAHYEIFRSAFPGIDIRSVTSGFPQHQLGVGVAHPAFPHEINKVWEIIEPEASPSTQLLWALGLVPMPCSDHWSFVLDVLFCGITHAGLKYHEATNMPFWKLDKFIRRRLGPNPFRAHDAIGASGANFLTWSCLHHLGEHYADLFTPTDTLTERKETGQGWYPPNHFRPVVNWSLQGDDEATFDNWLIGPMIQMTSLLLHEQRSHMSHINAISELCAQFRPGILAMIRSLGTTRAIECVEAYHKLDPMAARSAWHPETLENMETPEWQQLYVNAEHDGQVGVITLSRESYSALVDAELNRAIDWLKAEKIDRVILTSDFHLSTQMVGADTSDFYEALDNVEKGIEVSRSWSETARRLHTEFATSVGFVNGKRCLGGCLELLVHCHFLVAVDDATLGMPEVTLPVVPGMEGCHWPFRKSEAQHWPKVLSMLLEGRSLKARDAVGWLIDFAGPLDTAIKTVWAIACGDHQLAMRKVVEDGLTGLSTELQGLSPAVSEEMEAGRRAITEAIRGACAAHLSEALAIQARHSGMFMPTAACRAGTIGASYTKTMAV